MDTATTHGHLAWIMPSTVTLLDSIMILTPRLNAYVAILAQKFERANGNPLKKKKKNETKVNYLLFDSALF